LWDEFYQKGIIALGWDEIGDLKQFKSREEIKKALEDAYGGTGSKKNDVSANDDFLNKVKMGDIIIAKKGRGELDIAEINAIQQKTMNMKDWIEVLDGFLKMSRQDVLSYAGRISAEIAREKALAEYETYNSKSNEELSEVEKQFIASIEEAEKQLKNHKK